MRSLSSALLVVSLLSSLNACSSGDASSDSSPTNQGGTAGAGGSSGASQGGASGDAGSSGSGGSSAGAAGTAGSSGAAGSAGNAGAAGNGGTAGSAGASGSAGSGGTGTAGSAGSGGGPLTGAGYVTIQKDGPKFTVLRDGQPYLVRGVGGQGHLDRAVQMGATSIRTWGSENAGAVLDNSANHGLTVLLGIWLSHDAGSFNDEGYKNQIRGELQGLLDQYKNHPALLMWAIGNEINLGADTPEAWGFVNELAAMVHAQDPNHPAVTVIAGANGGVIENIVAHAPSIDVIGINSYGGVTGVGDAVAATSFAGPYMVTEWGPTGHWEVQNTSWNAPVEPPSADKADVYGARWAYLVSQADRCVGSYVFLWGQKEERTPTWYGMFAETRPDLGLSEQTYATVDVLQHAWTGQWPGQRAPLVTSVVVDGKHANENVQLSPGQQIPAQVSANDPEGDALAYSWELLVEASQLGNGGSAEPRPDAVPGAISGSGEQITLTAPGPGKYRLYVYALDGHGGVGSANLPFLVQ